MSGSPDLLKDFIDGKLASEEASGVAARIANDPDLAAYVEDQKALHAALASPGFARLRRARDAIAASPSWVPALTMAAGIGLGVLLAGSFGIGTDVRSDAGTLIAQGELAYSLSMSLPADEIPSAGAARIGASFWSKNGSFCRSFETRGNSESALAGIACRERGAWRIATSTAIAPADVAQSRLVTAALPASVRSVMDNLIVGEPLDADAERQARNQGWRTR
jgi:anti-sigma factor RsiW